MVQRPKVIVLRKRYLISLGKEQCLEAREAVLYLLRLVYVCRIRIRTFYPKTKK